MAASKLFSLHGVAGTSMGTIAAEAGLRGPSLYYYYDSKRAIVDELIAQAVAGTVLSTHAARRRRQPIEQLRSLLEPHLRHLLHSDLDLYFLLGPTAGGDAPERHPEAYAEWRAAVQTAIVRGCESGAFRPIDAAFGLHMVVGCIQGALLLKHQGVIVDPDDVTAFVLAALGQACE